MAITDRALRLDWMPLYWACRVALVGFPDARVSIIAPKCGHRHVVRIAGEHCSCEIVAEVSPECGAEGIALLAATITSEWEKHHRAPTVEAAVEVGAESARPLRPGMFFDFTAAIGRATAPAPWENAAWN